MEMIIQRKMPGIQSAICLWPWIHNIHHRSQTHLLIELESHPFLDSQDKKSYPR